ncbi:15792_t:CDS:2 [Entrophospora sp. SA101]|nr:15792_t:CDS:2 [Entrophospora sp. SA101]
MLLILRRDDFILDDELKIWEYLVRWGISKGSVINELSSSSSLEEKIENRTDEMLYESFFRGRRLIGKKINLEQNNYEGHIFKESSMITSATSSEMELEEEKEQEIVVEKTRNWETVKKFDSFLVWQHNEIPKTSNDQIIKSLEWIKIANIVSTV